MSIVDFTKDPLTDLPPDDPRSPGYAYRLLNRGPRQAADFQPEPVPATGTITVANDQRGVHEHISAEDFASYQAQGWRYVPNPAANPPTDTARNLTRHVDDAPQTRDLWPAEQAARQGSQTGVWAWRTAVARQSLDDSANALAEYIGRPTVTTARANNRGGPLQASAVRASDYLAMAYSAEAVCKLVEEMQAMQAQVAALQAELAALKGQG